MDYYYYRLLVQTKITGANIHEVNGYLGLVLNSLSLMNQTEEDDDIYKRSKSTLIKAVDNIIKATGVYVDPLSLKYEK